MKIEEMKKIFENKGLKMKLRTRSIIVVLWIYLMGCFYTLSFNISMWEQAERLSILYLYGIVQFCVMVGYLAKIKD